MKFTRLIIFLGTFVSLSASALWFDNMPKLPMFGEFDPINSDNTSMNLSISSLILSEKIV